MGAYDTSDHYEKCTNTAGLCHAGLELGREWSRDTRALSQPAATKEACNEACSDYLGFQFKAHGTSACELAAGASALSDAYNPACMSRRTLALPP